MSHERMGALFTFRESEVCDYEIAEVFLFKHHTCIEDFAYVPVTNINNFNPIKRSPQYVVLCSSCFTAYCRRCNIAIEGTS